SVGQAGLAPRPDEVGGEHRRLLLTGGGEVQDVLVEGADLGSVDAVDLLARSPAAASLQRDERVAGDLVGEPGAPLAQDASIAVEQDLGGDLDRLGEGALDVGEPAGGPAVAHRLVLQRALAALVADRAVQDRKSTRLNSSHVKISYAV